MKNHPKKAVSTKKEAPEPKIDSTPASEAKSGTPDVAEHEQLRHDVATGQVAPTSEDAKEATAILQKPLVPALNGGKMVYETAKEAEMALAAQGKLTTPDPK